MSEFRQPERLRLGVRFRRSASTGRREAGWRHLSFLQLLSHSICDVQDGRTRHLRSLNMVPAYIYTRERTVVAYLLVCTSSDRVDLALAQSSNE
ncbi:uncharacterized protein LAESUDRAFT_12207 [Laetiporus sulphureus 93-53]|uniref:Uncharacterized protein n=1 Tax=Laetiporus sulphureus 93-53 TaxID=1314785 RepID=A0A165I7T7_9APHY|nr:uncharacterized protein LAESUDRAFT_12207 [Laetiporus sulphureus 93-53]KZT12698.1 hypothetical protein LAESUDRAFT_12207 [Laetiporus sulphureus 93-53]